MDSGEGIKQHVLCDKDNLEKENIKEQLLKVLLSFFGSSILKKHGLFIATYLSMYIRL